MLCECLSRKTSQDEKLKMEKNFMAAVKRKANCRKSVEVTLWRMAGEGETGEAGETGF